MGIRVNTDEVEVDLVGHPILPIQSPPRERDEPVELIIDVGKRDDGAVGFRVRLRADGEGLRALLTAIVPFVPNQTPVDLGIGSEAETDA